MNVLIANPKLPKRAGKANIFFDENQDSPTRKGADIVLPLTKDTQLVPLQRGRMFLLTGTAATRNGYYKENCLHFGGTDEEPFLVRLNPEALVHYRSGGEPGFFEALKPPLVRQAERLFMKTTRRQGDIFVMPTLFCWKSIQLFMGLGMTGEATPEAKGYERLPLFGTRHLFTGSTMTMRANGAEFPVAEGVIEAPDHEEISFDFPHVLSQTAFLWNPKEAD